MCVLHIKHSHSLLTKNGYRRERTKTMIRQHVCVCIVFCVCPWVCVCAWVCLCMICVCMCMCWINSLIATFSSYVLSPFISDTDIQLQEESFSSQVVSHLSMWFEDPTVHWGHFSSLAFQNAIFLLFEKFCFNVYLFFLRERERESMSGGGAERETQNLKQAPGSELSAQSPTQGSDPQTARSWHKMWDHGLSQSRLPNRLSLQVPQPYFYSWEHGSG